MPQDMPHTKELVQELFTSGGFGIVLLVRHQFNMCLVKLKKINFLIKIFKYVQIIFF